MKIEMFSIALNQIQIKEAKLKVQTVLSGPRYLMHTYFWSTGFIFISGLTLTITASIMLVLILVKTVLTLNN